MAVKVSKNQRPQATTTAVARGVAWTSQKCGCCGARLRLKFTPGKGNKARLQHSRWFVCERGHQVYRKRG